MILSVILAILLFGLIVFIHELGHFLAARLFGVTVREFSVGMGPAFFKKRSEKSGTVYSLRVLPVGGYVSMEGENSDSTDDGAFCKKPKYQRFLILFAGAFMNLLLGFLVMLVCVSSGDKLYSNKIESFLVMDSETGSVVTEYRGLLPGDEMIAVGSQKLRVRYDYLFAAMRKKDTPCTLTVKRGEDTIEIEDFRFPVFKEDGTVFGNPSFFIPAEKEKSAGNIIYETFHQTVAVVRTVILSLYDLAVGNFGPDAVSGPVGVVSEIHETASYGASAVLFLFALIAVNVGVMNLVPFPALDGGRILLILAEAVLRRPIDKKVENFINFMGIVMLFGFMILITTKDITKLFTA